MPEFEETDSKPNPSHSYTPSTDATKKPRGRRRSGGFKTEVASSSTAGMGEVSVTDALKGEKLSGAGRLSQEPEQRAPSEKRERKPHPEHTESSIDTTQEERPSREPRAPREREPRAERAPREPREKREPRKEREPREERVTNPQPSEATLASIKRVEATLTERRAERDARRKERDANRPAKSERKPDARGNKPQPKSKAKQPQKQGLLAKILGIFGIGNKPAEKPTGNRGGQNRKSGNRGGQNRQGGNRGGQSRNGNRGGQNRKTSNRGGDNRRAGNRGRQARRQGGNEKPHSAKSLSNES